MNHCAHLILTAAVAGILLASMTTESYAPPSPDRSYVVRLLYQADLEGIVYEDKRDRLLMLSQIRSNPDVKDHLTRSVHCVAVGAR